MLHYVEFKIKLQVPSIKVLSLVELQNQLVEQFNQDSLSAVLLNFQESFIGSAHLVFPKEIAIILVSLLTAEKPENSELDFLKIGTIVEVGNIILNNIIGSISNIIRAQMRYLVPLYKEGTIETMVLLREYEPNTLVILATACLDVEELKIKGEIILIFQLDSFNSLLRALEQLE